MSIGTTIKQLRKEKNITQEQLAEYLGITSRAISQWECDRTAPDISQLPALANIFEVSADVLLGIDITQKAKRISEIIKESIKHHEVGHMEEVMTTLRTGLKEFPNSYVLMGELLNCLSSMTNDSEQKTSLLQEGISLGEKILEECTIDYVRHNAIRCLCSLYTEKGDVERAIALATKMPPLFSCAENLLSGIYTGSKRIEHIQCKLSSLLCLVYNDLWRITEPAENGTSSYTNQEYIQILEKFPAIMDIVIEDKNYGLFAIQLIGAKLKLAQYYMLEQMPEKALECLQDATEYAIRYDTGLHAGGNYTCLLFRNIGFGPTLISINENQCLLLLHRLEESAFDQVREHTGFIRIVEELQKYAKEL